MDQSFEPQPRDSRLEKFSAAATNIISVERGLTSTAWKKIRSLAREQRLSEAQVIECLNRISDGGSALGRVGRYEQIFLDRLNNDLSRINGSVLSPKTAQESIQLAAVEYQIGAPRARQLLEHVARERGLQLVSAADARNRIRALITQRLESSNHKRRELGDELVAHAADFGIDADEVSRLWDAEIESRTRMRAGRKNRLIAAAGIILAVIGLSGLGGWLWLNTKTPALLDQTTPEPIDHTNTIDDQDVQTVPDVKTTDGSQDIIAQPTKNPSASTNGGSKFEIANFLSMPAPAPVLRFEKWQRRFVELVGQDFEQSPPDTREPAFADRQKKRAALDALKSTKSDTRILARALDDLSAIAPRVDDITPEEAGSIAAFCLAKHSAATEVSILRSVKPFGRWPHFLLAVSDAFAGTDRQSSPVDWNQRVAVAITNGKLKRDDDLSASFFALARLRVRELLNQRKQKESTVESALVEHLRLFIFNSVHTLRHQRYFSRLIDARDLRKPSMQRQIELQQILIEALLFAKRDDVSLEIGETHFSRLNSSPTQGEQLAQSRETALKLVQRHLEWLKQDGTAFTNQRWRPDRISASEARRLRDEAEDIVIAGDETQFQDAIAKYTAAIDCGDGAIIRSCLRGLIAIADNRADLNGYRRQLDFINGGQLGPCSAYFSAADDGSSTQTDWRAIKAWCRQIRRSLNSSQKAPKPAADQASEIGAAFEWLANRRSALSLFELDLLLRIEAEATVALESREASYSPIRLPRSIQATLPAVDVTPLVPLRR